MPSHIPKDSLPALLREAQTAPDDRRQSMTPEDNVGGKRDNLWPETNLYARFAWENDGKGTN